MTYTSPPTSYFLPPAIFIRPAEIPMSPIDNKTSGLPPCVSGQLSHGRPSLGLGGQVSQTAPRPRFLSQSLVPLFGDPHPLNRGLNTLMCRI